MSFTDRTLSRTVGATFLLVASSVLLNAFRAVGAADLTCTMKSLNSFAGRRFVTFTDAYPGSEIEGTRFVPR